MVGKVPSGLVGEEVRAKSEERHHVLGLESLPKDLPEPEEAPALVWLVSLVRLPSASEEQRG